MSPILQSLLLAAAAAVASAKAVPPSTGSDWITLPNGMEFQPSQVQDDPVRQRALRNAQDRILEEQQAVQKQTNFVDSAETYYDAYAQAWRYVGFYTDCHEPSEERHRRRQLNENEEDACQRYLLWAAYVDLGYTGKGIGEYQFWDTYSEEWDTSACEAVGNIEEDGTVDPSTCKKMDCHMPDTETWQLMGYFKEPEYTEWFEQLFKHEGYCVWQGDEYEFMYGNYDAWPEGCSETEYYLSDGTLLYYDTKAEANATMTYGLYTDARCSVDYVGEEVTMEDVLMKGDHGGDDLLSLQYLQYWNEAMEIYRVCQPCRAYALHDGYGGERRRRQLADPNYKPPQGRKLEDNDPNNGLFQCDDAAGYTNVNQCMKFRTKTDMYYATTDEVMEAAFQGGITTLTVGSRVYGEYRAGHDVVAEEPDWMMLYIGCAVLAFGSMSLLTVYLMSRTRCRTVRNKSLKKPLITDL